MIKKDFRFVRFNHNNENNRKEFAMVNLKSRYWLVTR